MGAALFKRLARAGRLAHALPGRGPKSSSSRAANHLPVPARQPQLELHLPQDDSSVFGFRRTCGCARPDRFWQERQTQKRRGAQLCLAPPDAAGICRQARSAKHSAGGAGLGRAAGVDPAARVAAAVSRPGGDEHHSGDRRRATARRFHCLARDVRQKPPVRHCAPVFARQPANEPRGVRGLHGAVSRRRPPCSDPGLSGDGARVR